MTKIWIEQGVIWNLQPVAHEGFRRVIKLAVKMGCDIYVLSGAEGDHQPDSLHYPGLAWDMRTNGFTKQVLLVALGKEWDVIAYDWGFHCEYDPKGK